MSTVKLWAVAFFFLTLVIGTCCGAATQAAPAAVYQESCGGCHFTYPPFLLPSGSWDKMISRLPSHFEGQEVELPPETATVVKDYLKANAAERSPAKAAGKIMSSLGGATPERITETPYMQHKHSKIGLETLKRKSVGSLANCIACHKAADKGDFSKHSREIPR